ncbi:MAG: universal stress protein [Mycobacterium sp.]|uniref:universal stress protein n=1 Tax=Mycobacterium sp. TaxID=1785 RepID=UPI003BB7ACB3
MQRSDPPAAVVVGIDGSNAAVKAALWAIDEAVDRDIPLRLVYAIDPSETFRRNAESVAHRLFTAEIAVRYALMAVEASGELVKVEVEIVQEQPLTALTRASRSAAMVCIGAVGLNQRVPMRVGSLALALMSASHSPLAIVRGHDSLDKGTVGWIAVELDESSRNSELVERAVNEARLRRVPLRALAAGQPESSAGDRRVAEGSVLTKQLEHQLVTWIRRYPDIDIRSVAVRGTILDHLAEQGRSVKLVVASADGSAVRKVLHGTDCSLLVVPAQP